MTLSARRRLLSVDAATHPLPGVLSAGSEVLDGHPEAQYCALPTGDTLSAGIWEMSAGKVVDVEEHEVFVVVSGRGTLQFADGEEIDLAPGTVVELLEGDRTTWTVHERLRKVYVSP